MKFHSDFARTRWCGFALWAIVLTLLVAPVGAQFSSNVQGTVTDPTGAAIPNAQVTLLNLETGVALKATTDAVGYYRFTSVARGNYRVLAECTGFVKSQADVAVRTEQTAGVDLQLALAGTKTEMVVSEKVPGINPDETRMESSLQAGQIPGLPLQNRAIFNVIALAPGITGIQNEPDRLDSISIDKPKLDSSANGRPGTANLYRMDGISIMSSNDYGSGVFPPAPDMLQEVALQTTSFSAENGSTSSLVVDFTTKSGGNDWHGDVDLTYNSKALWSRQMFTSEQAPFTRKWFSGTLGGPIVKNKLFVFGSVVTRRSATGTSGLVDYEPDELVNWAKAKFPQSQGVNLLWAKFRPTRVDFQQVNSYARDAFGADCGTAATYYIPCDMPMQDRGYFNQAPKLNGTQFNIRGDYYMKDGRDRVFANFFRVGQMSDYLDSRPQFDAQTPSRNYYGAMSWVHTVSANLINQAQVGVVNYENSFGKDSGEEYAKTPFITLICCSPFYFIGSPFAPNANLENSYRFRDFASWQKGQHSLRFGFEFSRLNYWQDRAGIFSRPFVPFYLSLWDFIADKPMNYSLYTLSATTGKWVGQYYGAQTNQYALYVQDEWKVRPNLLLSLGLRFDDFGNPTPYGEHAMPYVQTFPGQGSTFADQITQASVRPVDAAFAGRVKSILPRVGVAWSPMKDKRWNVRGGFGLYSDALDLAGVTAALPTQPPNRLTLDLNMFNPNLPAPTPPYGSNTNGPPYGFQYPVVDIKGFTEHGAPIGYPAGIFGTTYDLSPQKTAIWNLSVERELPASIVLGLTYSGSHAWNLFQNDDFNRFDGDMLDGTFDRRTTEWGRIAYTRNALRSNYHGMIWRVRQSWRKVNWQASYTFSKSLDNAAAIAPDKGWVNPLNPDGFYSYSDFDVRHAFSLGGNVELPGPTTGFWKHVAGGWNLGVISIAQTGVPFSVIDTRPFSEGGDYNADGVNNDYGNLGPNIKQYSGWNKEQYMNGIFQASDFNKPAGYGQAAVYSNQPRNLFRNPPFFTIDSSLVKKIALPWFGDRQSFLHLRVEAMNVLNKVNLGRLDNANTPSNDLANPGRFGYVTTARQPRVFQLGARFEF